MGSLDGSVKSLISNWKMGALIGSKTKAYLNSIKNPEENVY